MARATVLLGVWTAGCAGTPPDPFADVSAVVVAVSTDGTWLAVGGGGRLLLYRIGDAGVQESHHVNLAKPGTLTQLAVLVAPLRVAVGRQEGLAIWTPGTGQPVSVDDRPVQALAVRGDELAVAAYPASIGEGMIGRLEWRDRDPPRVPTGVALLPDGRTVVGDDRGLLTVPDTTGEMRKIKCGEPIDGVLVTLTGEVIVGGDKHPRRVKPKAKESEPLGTARHERWIRRMALSGDGLILATTDGADVLFVDVASGAKLGQLPARESTEDRVLDLALSRDGSVVFVAYAVSGLSRQAWRSEAGRKPGR